MSRVRRAITAFFFFSSSSINVIFYFLENVCLSNPPFPLLFPKSCVCVGGGGWGGGGRVGGWLDVQARVVYVSE